MIARGSRLRWRHADGRTVTWHVRAVVDRGHLVYRFWNGERWRYGVKTLAPIRALVRAGRVELLP